LWEKRRVACLTLEPGKIEKSFSPKLTDYFIQGVRKKKYFSPKLPNFLIQGKRNITLGEVQNSKICDTRG
jgi:hypothetical protein